MPRNIGVDVNDQTPVYRAVILYLYPGIHNRTLKTYTTEDGTVHQYHQSESYGPYGTRAPATGQVTSALRYHEDKKARGSYTVQHVFNPTTRSYDAIQNGSVPEVIGFTEEQIPGWKVVPGSYKTPQD